MPTPAQRRRSCVCGTAATSLLLALAACSAQHAEAPTSGDPRDVPVEVRGVVLDPTNNSPVVVLEEREGERSLPIWIGQAEARSIAVELEDVEWPRPNSHDLAKRLLAGLDATVERVVVTELRESTYFAVLVVRRAGERLDIDARPSDAIAIALRMNAPIFVRDGLLGEQPGERETGSEEELTL